MRSPKSLSAEIEHRDHVVSKEEILAEVWQDTVVSDNALSRAIARIRRVIGDDSRQPTYVQTVPRVGYRLIAVARTSSFAFRGKEQGIAAIAAALRVRHVLEGSVRRMGSRIRVTAQLIDASDGRHVWSERYDREVTDVFAVQDEISEAISAALRVQLAPPVRTANLQAYQLHLKGRYYLLQLSQESMARAPIYFEQALAIDPGYAAAHSALAEHHHSRCSKASKSPGDSATPS